MTRQIAVRIPDDLAGELENLVRDGEYRTLAEAVRAAIGELAERKRRQKLDDAIVEGYRRQPPTVDEDLWAAAAGRDFISEEPW